MPGSTSGDLFSNSVDLFAQRVNEYASGIAQRLGSPMSGTQLSKDQVLQRWNFSPLGDTQAADAQYHQLVAQGMPQGQALDQVYPYRKTLFSGPDLGSQIDTAKKIAGWAADASGTEPPQPNPQQSPILPQSPAPAPAPLPAGGAPPPGGLPGPPVAPPGPVGAAPGGGLPLPVATPQAPPAPGFSPMPQGMPMPPQGVAPGEMPPITPVPGVSS
jgi:hypothetical protein